MIYARTNRLRIAAATILSAAALLFVSAALAMFVHRAPAGATDGGAVVAIPPKQIRAAEPVPARAPPAAPEPTLEIKRVLDLPAIAFGDWAWDETGAPTGRLVMTVDLEAQTISVFRGGYEIGAAAILYGADDKPTPLGRFPILEKDADHVSSLYDAPMPYMLRLTTDGVAIHGSEVEWGLATHGCIGVPTSFAKRLFAAARPGDLVIVTRGELLKPGDRVV